MYTEHYHHRFDSLTPDQVSFSINGTHIRTEGVGPYVAFSDSPDGSGGFDIKTALETPATHDDPFYSLPVGQNLTVTVTAVDDGIELANGSLVVFVNEDAVL